MSDSPVAPPQDRSRLGWWLFVALLAVVATLIAYEFIGILVLAIFGYYATRPINDRLATAIDSDDVAAWATVLVVLIPLLLLVFYAGIQLALQAQQALGSIGVLPQDLLQALPVEQRTALQSAFRNPTRLLSNPQRILDVATMIGSVLGVISGVLLRISLAITLTYFLLANDKALADGFRRIFGGTDSTAYAYGVALDEDFESVWFGNFLFVLVMAVIATVTYWWTNLVAPSGLHIPMVLVLGFLTGVASLIPLVVGKVVYLPVIAALGLQASQAQGTPYLFVGIVLVVYFFVLDFLPQTFVQPYITGRQLDTVMMMFGYLLGPILFGWYGLFLLPMIFIVILEAIRIVVPNLVRGEPMTTEVEIGEAVGTTPRATRDAVPETDGSDDAEETVSDESEGANEDAVGESNDANEESVDESDD